MLDRLSLIESLLARRDDRENQSIPMDTEPLLDRVLQEINAIQPDTKNATNHTGDCNVEGYWLSESAGGMFKFPPFDGSAGQEVPLEHIRVRDHVHNGFMKIKSWTTTLLYPFMNNSQYVIINAVDERDKLVATFMGECRICRKRELLQGNWVIVSHSRDCESLGTTAKLISDVFRRDNTKKLSKQQHLKEIKAKKAHHQGKLAGHTVEGSSSPPSLASKLLQARNQNSTNNVESSTHKTITHKTTMLPIKLH